MSIKTKPTQMFVILVVLSLQCCEAGGSRRALIHQVFTTERKIMFKQAVLLLQGMGVEGEVLILLKFRLAWHPVGQSYVCLESCSYFRIQRVSRKSW